MHQTLDDKSGLQFAGDDAIWNFSAKQVSTDPQNLAKQTEATNIEHERDALPSNTELNSEQADWATRWPQWTGKSSRIDAFWQSAERV